MPDTTAVRDLASLPYMPVAQTDSAAFSTSLFDSVAADTVAGRIPHFISPAEADSLQRCREIEDSIASIPPPGREAGMMAGARANPYAHSSALTGLLVTVLVVLAIKSKSVVRALKSYRNELWSVRRRGNVFDDERSVSLPVAVLLAFVYMIFGGLVLYNLPTVPANPTVGGALISMGIMAAYYIFGRIACWVVGITFASPEECSRWLGGFAATKAYAGLAFIIPSLLMLFYPQWHEELIIISLSIFFIAKILFIIKGFRIFYKGIVYLFYFILYLCTLEIIPLIILYGIASGRMDITLHL